MVLSLLLISCATPPKYSDQDKINVIAIESGGIVKTRVSAAIEEWRNTGLLIEEGKKYQISAQGQWRTYPSCNFTGPDGIGLYKDWCVKSPLFPAIIEGFSHSALIAKISDDNKPFLIGAEQEFIAESTGPLLLRINDVVNGNSDNEGFVDVEIKQLVASNKLNPSDLNAQIETDTETLSALVKNIPNQALEPTALKRTALIIGNSRYTHSPLKNPVNDAQAMAKALNNLGFKVIVELDANQEKMEAAIDQFGRYLISGNQIGLFYYAGHGVQVDGENYLIPVAAQIKRQSDVRYKAINIGQVLGAMGEANDNLNIVILDACRDNPLPRSFRSGSRGLARVEGPKGTIIGFATSPGSTAADGEGDNGLYTKHLLSNIQNPGLSIEQVFKKVLQGVNDETKGQQVPWTESSFTGDFSFSPNL